MDQLLSGLDRGAGRVGIGDGSVRLAVGILRDSRPYTMLTLHDAKWTRVYEYS